MTVTPDPAARRDDPLRVVIDARIPDGAYGGVQQWVIGLAHGMRQLPDDGTEYLFLVREDGAPWLEPYVGDSAHILHPDPHPELVRPTPRLSLVRRLRRGTRRVLGRARAGVGHLVGRTSPPRAARPRRGKGATPWSDGTIEAAGADVMHFPFQSAFRTTVPSIYQPWDLQHLHLPEFFTPAQQARRAAAYPLFCRQATLVVVASAWVKADVVESFGIPPDRIEVVPVPPPTDAYPAPGEAERAAIRERLALPERFVYYPAQTWPHKNHARLFQALRLLADGGLEVPLVGTGRRNDHYATLEAQARELGIEGQLHFLGYVEPAVVTVLYSTARALVFPSLYEGWGLPIVEAFRAGLPVACSNVTSLPELVGNAALVFDPLDPASIADAIEQLWTDDALASKLAADGRRVAEAFDWRTTAQAMRRHYRRVARLGGDRGSAAVSREEGSREERR